jgi:Holliday junction resolvase RusA-like endonuclease
MDIKHYVEVPKSYPQKKRWQCLKGILAPTSRPDLDNIAKTICDSLNKVAYHDDSQIVDLTITKKYAEYNYTQITIRKYDSDKHNQ